MIPELTTLQSKLRRTKEEFFVLFWGHLLSFYFIAYLKCYKPWTNGLKKKNRRAPHHRQGWRLEVTAVDKDDGAACPVELLNGISNGGLVILSDQASCPTYLARLR